MISSACQSSSGKIPDQDFLCDFLSFTFYRFGPQDDLLVSFMMVRSSTLIIQECVLTLVSPIVSLLGGSLQPPDLFSLFTNTLQAIFWDSNYEEYEKFKRQL